MKARPSARMRSLALLKPRDREELHALVAGLFGLEVPRVVRAPGSSAPFDYLCHAFFEPTPSMDPGLIARLDAGRFHLKPGGDAVVWANRGGGKTLLGAVATLLDLLFKPGIEVRVLGASLEQANKMFEHLLRLLDEPTLREGGGVLATGATGRRVLLQNGSRVEVLAGSQRSVRGVRVHKLRCDEVEELDPAVWAAAQLVTRSGYCGDSWVGGSIEALSTMHRVGGVMSRLVRDGGGTALVEQEAGTTPNPGQRTCGKQVFRWNAMDVVARCPETLLCEGCVLWDDCHGRAKTANGFLPVTDLIAQWHRSSRSAWDAEMMCRRPRADHAVFPTFDEASHVQPFTPTADGTWLAGMDFGLRAPTVMLWAHLETDGVLHVVGEYAATDRTLPEHLRHIDMHARDAELPAADRIAWLAIDPAGNARNAHTGQSDAALLRSQGYTVRSRPAAIAAGIEAVRRRLDHRTLHIDPRCPKLIAALAGYHFDPRNLDSAVPVKDGPDHWCDALRYLAMSLETAPQSPATANYL